jgi:large subunit ribosomal protein L29
MKTADLRAKTTDQLKEDLVALGKERFNLRFQKSSGQLENTGVIRIARRNVARVKTVLNEQKQGKVPAVKAAKKAVAPKTAAKKKTKE